MRAAVFFEKQTFPGDAVPERYVHGEQLYPSKSWVEGIIIPSVLTLNFMIIAPGTYTLYADVPAGVRCKVYTWNGDDAAAGQYPENDGEGVLPFTFTVNSYRYVRAAFAYTGEWAHGDTPLALSDVQNVRLHNTAHGETEPVYETRIVRPEEIPENAVIAKARNCKSSISLTIFPDSDAWGFCERSITYVRVLDLDLPQDRMIFKGRVTGVSSRLSGGKYSEEILCASALGFLEDTPAVSIPGSIAQTINNWLTEQILAHNSRVEWIRKMTFHSDVPDTVYITTKTAEISSVFEMMSEYFNAGDKLYRYENGARYVDPLVLEYRERYANDITYIDVSEKFGTDRDTPFRTGENLKSITVKKDTDGGIYTSLRIVSGICSDGTRYSYEAENPEMTYRYGKGRTKIVRADGIVCTAPTHEWVSNVWQETSEYRQMKQYVEYYAKKEAMKLSDPPVELSLSAEDLAALGFSGYEPFEIYDSYPIVEPRLGYFGKRGRITELRRRLCDGRVEGITIETGQRLAKAAGSEPPAKRYERETDETAENQAKATQEATGGVTIKSMTIEEYEAIGSHDRNTMYIVDNNGTIEVYVGDDRIGDEGGGTIHNAVVLSGEQGQEWAPDHELLPVWFRGNASMWYGGTPARVVVNGQRGLCGIPDSELLPDDIMSEITLQDFYITTTRYVAYISRMGGGSFTVKIQIYENGEYVGETDGYTWQLGNTFQSRQVGMILEVGSWSSWQTDPQRRLYPNCSLAYAVIQDGVGYTSSRFALPGRIINPIRVSEAESGFGSGLAIRSEPQQG